LIYRVRRRAVVMHRVGTHRQLFAVAGRRGRRPIGHPRRAR
jgi:hypothetical protein